MRTIQLYGELGAKYGKEHRLSVKSPAEAIRALCANFPTFHVELLEAEKRGMGFRVVNGKTELDDLAQLRDPASGTLKIIPAVIGAGGDNPWTRIFIGAALIAAAVFVPPLAGVAAGSFAAGVAGVAFNVGVALALGGVAQILSPSPASEGPKEDAENTPSYIFNGPVNTVATGHPVPVGYGRLIVGGAVISAGISIEQEKTGKRRVLVRTTSKVGYYVSTGNLVPNGLLGGLYLGYVPDNTFIRTFVGRVNHGFPVGEVDQYDVTYYVPTVIEDVS